MTWANNEDLLIGDMELGSTNASQYLDIALREMNTRLGQVYALPLNENSLADYQKETLKTIQAQIASGRLIMAQAAGSESESLHAYGRDLVAQGYGALDAIGFVYELDGQTRVGTAGEDRRPSVSSADTTSPFDIYADVVHGQADTFVEWDTSS